MQTINERVIKIRESKGLKQKDFSESIGFPRSSLSEIENGKRCPPVELIVCISTKFHEINVDWLLTGEGTMYRNEKPSPLDPEIAAVVSIMKELEPDQKTTVRASAEAAKQFTQMKRQLSELTMRLSA